MLLVCGENSKKKNTPIKQSRNSKKTPYEKKKTRKEPPKPFFPGLEPPKTAAERLEKRKKIIVQFQMYKDYEINPSNTNREVEKTL